MALVDVPHRRFDVEGVEQSHGADSEEQFLVEPHLPPAHIEDVRHRPVGRAVLRDVAVQEQQRHPPHVDAPHPELHDSPGELHRDAQR